MGKGNKEESMDEKKKKKKLKDMKEEVNGQSLIQTRTLWTGVDKKKERKREREREQYLLGYMEYQYSPFTGLVPLIKAQGILSRRS